MPSRPRRDSATTCSSARTGPAAASDEATAATDDAALVEAIGEPVWVVEGHADALKITTARDLLLAEALLQARR